MAKLTTYYKGDMLFESKLGNHSVLADVPPSMGGSDRAPTPPELLVASLGACIGAFVADYCRRVGIDATDLTVDVAFEKAADPTRLINLHATINLPHGEIGNRDQAILRVARHCPVHETMVALEHVAIDLAGQTP